MNMHNHHDEFRALAAVSTISTARNNVESSPMSDITGSDTEWIEHALNNNDTYASSGQTSGHDSASCIDISDASDDGCSAYFMSTQQHEQPRQQQQRGADSAKRDFGGIDAYRTPQGSTHGESDLDDCEEEEDAQEGAALPPPPHRTSAARSCHSPGVDPTDLQAVIASIKSFPPPPPPNPPPPPSLREFSRRRSAPADTLSEVSAISGNSGPSSSVSNSTASSVQNLRKQIMAARLARHRLRGISAKVNDAVRSARKSGVNSPDEATGESVRVRAERMIMRSRSVKYADLNDSSEEDGYGSSGSPQHVADVLSTSGSSDASSALGGLTFEKDRYSALEEDRYLKDVLRESSSGARGGNRHADGTSQRDAHPDDSSERFAGLGLSASDDVDSHLYGAGVSWVSIGDESSHRSTPSSYRQAAPSSKGHDNAETSSRHSCASMSYGRGEDPVNSYLRRRERGGPRATSLSRKSQQSRVPRKSRRDSYDDSSDEDCRREPLTHAEAAALLRLSRQAPSCGRPSSSSAASSRRSAGPRPKRWTTNSVRIHVYDLLDADAYVQLFSWGCDFPIGRCFNVVNSGLHAIGTGAYHVGVEVNGIEFAYGANSVPGLSGVFTCIPRQSPGYEYRTTLDFGERRTTRREGRNDSHGQSPSSVADRKALQNEEGEAEQFIDGHFIMQRMAYEYMGSDYDLLRKNCCTFAHDACLRLGVKDEEIPTWFLHLAETGADAEDAMTNVENSVLVPIKRMLSGEVGPGGEEFRCCDEKGIEEENRNGFELIVEKKKDDNMKSTTESEIVRVVEAIGVGFRKALLPTA